MAVEGMVHALNRAHRLVRSDGRVLDIHPAAEPAPIEMKRPSLGTFRIGRLRDADARRRHLAADAAVAASVDAGTFAIEAVRRFSFRRYADTIEELQRYVVDKWSTAHVDAPTMERARRAGPGMLWLRERVTMTLLRPN